MTSIETLTYQELAERLGIKVASARKMVQRKRWKRLAGNDGLVRIQVPVDALSPKDSPKDGSRDSPSDGHRDSPTDSPYVRELEVRIEGLKVLVEAERKRADAAELDRDRWHAHALRPWWRRLAG